jgi:branched-chain amino acid transport system ATP-binding protein
VSAVSANVAPMLEVSGIHASYDRIEVLYGVDLVVPEGSVFALLGPNGAGKSTTLKIISGLHEPDSGEIRIAGRKVNNASPDALVRAGVSTVPEGRGIFANLTVAENLLMATYAGVSKDKVEAIAFERFPRLKERRTQLAGTLSGGEQQMLALSRSLAVDPALLLLDELSSGLAPIIVEELYEIVARLADEGVSILVVEQFARTVLGVADHAAVMVHGRIAVAGKPDQIEDELSAAYLGA